MKLTPHAQDRILSRCPWSPDGKLLVVSTLKTRPLLRMAGIRNPQVLHTYHVDVHREIIDGRIMLLLGAPRTTHEDQPAA